MKNNKGKERKSMKELFISAAKIFVTIALEEITVRASRKKKKSFSLFGRR